MQCYIIVKITIKSVEKNEIYEQIYLQTELNKQTPLRNYY